MRAIVCLAILASPALAFGQSDVHDHRIVYAAGWAGDRDISGGTGFQPAGASIGFEVTPIEGWLSIETSVEAHHSDEGTEMPIEVAFRKPWQLSKTVEFMAGVAPEIVRRFGASGETFGGVSFGGHFMIWPRPNIGWYAEAAYEVAFPQDGTHKSIAFAAGILIGR